MGAQTNRNALAGFLLMVVALAGTATAKVGSFPIELSPELWGVWCSASNPACSKEEDKVEIAPQRVVAWPDSGLRGVCDLDDDSDQQRIVNYPSNVWQIQFACREQDAITKVASRWVLNRGSANNHQRS